MLKHQRPLKLSRQQRSLKRRRLLRLVHLTLLKNQKKKRSQTNRHAHAIRCRRRHLMVCGFVRLAQRLPRVESLVLPSIRQALHVFTWRLLRVEFGRQLTTAQRGRQSLITKVRIRLALSHSIQRIPRPCGLALERTTVSAVFRMATASIVRTTAGEHGKM